MVLIVFQQLVQLQFSGLGTHASVTAYYYSIILERLHDFFDIIIPITHYLCCLSAGQLELGHEYYEMQTGLIADTDLFCAAFWLHLQHIFDFVQSYHSHGKLSIIYRL